jgi:hypothetical protein
MYATPLAVVPQSTHRILEYRGANGIRVTNLFAGETFIYDKISPGHYSDTIRASVTASHLRRLSNIKLSLSSREGEVTIFASEAIFASSIVAPTLRAAVTMEFISVYVV